MRTKRISKLLTAITSLFIALFLGGCLFPMMWGKPGYGISIDVPIISKDAVDSIQNALIAEEFELRAEKDFNWKRDFSYSKYVAAESKKVDHPYINLTLSYEKGQSPERVTAFSIGLGNEWEGQQPQMKHEMDRIADIIISILRGSVGQENITVERKAIGPPF
jgi:hypothetical protein